MTGGVTNGVIVFPLALNDLNFSLAVEATKQLSPIFEIRIGLPYSQNVFFSRLLCLSPQFLFQPPILTPPLLFIPFFEWGSHDGGKFGMSVGPSILYHLLVGTYLLLLK